MKYLISLHFFFLSSIAVSAQETSLLTRFEKSGKTETVTYEEGIAFYKRLAAKFPEITIREMGLTDSGKPLHIVIYSSEREFDFEKIKAGGKPVFLINNAIHAGEPDGVDASMMLMRDLATGKILASEKDQLVLVVIPFYNIGGVLNRNSTTRVNQNGPVSYGFRGNARLYDLNRDFIKSDTRNARSFWDIYHLTDPDMFLDTHVSNGADYQYAITLIASQENKLSEPLREIMTEKISPDLYRHMEEAKEPMTPFVNVYGKTPDKGFSEFADWPRYSTGYTALFDTYGFMSETHMLKPFGRRVEATYDLMKGMAKTLVKYREEIINSRKIARRKAQEQEEFAIKWQLKKDFETMISFRGYEGRLIDSDITSQKRLFYDRSKPFVKQIPYKNQYEPAVTVQKPAYYIIPQGWHQVIDRLKANNVQMQTLPSDTSLVVSAYRITGYETVKSIYEGHYYHYNITLEDVKQAGNFFKGDYIIRCDQEVNRFIIETLEPLAEDSFFKWNFFDTILAGKEGFSGYVFEELAKDILANDAKLNRDFRERQKSDEDFASSRYLQLKFIYDRSKFKEKSHLLYPVFRIK